jgi:hypothetical protein
MEDMAEYKDDLRPVASNGKTSFKGDLDQSQYHMNGVSLVTFHFSTMTNHYF